MSGHTPGKLAVELNRAEDGDVELVLEGGEPGCETSLARVFCQDLQEVPREQALANAHRLASIWNALEGVADPSAALAQAKAYLSIIAGSEDQGCDRFHKGKTCRECDWLTPNAEFTADRWCSACIARAALAKLDSHE